MSSTMTLTVPVPVSGGEPRMKLKMISWFFIDKEIGNFIDIPQKV